MGMIKLNTIKLKAQKGRTILGATDVFPGYIDSCFRNWGLNRNVTQSEIQERNFNIKELTENMTFAQMFNTETDVMSQEEIVAFCQQYPNYLHPDGFPTFFLIKENGDYYVVNTDFLPTERRACVRKIDDDHVWDAKNNYRLVVP